MFCPYVRKTYCRFTGIHYNGDSIEDGSVICETFENAECLKEQCGVWYEGRCNYRCNSHD